MKIITLLFLCSILCKKFILSNAKREVVSDNHVNINLLASISKAIDPHQKKFYGFVCWDDADSFQMLVKNLNMNTFSFGLQKISTENMPYHAEFQASTILLDFACHGAQYFWQKLNLELLMTNKILLINVETSLFKLISEQKGLGSVSEVYVIDHEAMVVKKVIKQEFHSNVRFETFATWINDTLVVVRPKQELISKSRYDLQGAPIRICIVIPTPDTFNHLTDGVDRHIDTNTKHGFVVTHELLDFLNATGNYSFASTWGYYNKTSDNWTGMIQKLVNNEADVGGTPVWITSTRVPIIHYVYRTTTANVLFLFQNPRLSFTENLFLLPFSQITWICFVLLVPVLGCGITFVRYFSEWKLRERVADEAQLDMEEPTLKDSFYMVVTIICQQGFTSRINSISARLLMFFSFVTLMLIYVSYAASLVALLQSSSRRINSLQDLLESKMTIGVEDTPYNRIYFPMQREPTKKAIYERKVINRDGSKNYVPVEIGVQKVRNELYAFFTEIGGAYRFVSQSFDQNEKCRINTLKYLNMDSPYHLIRKNATFKEVVTVGLSRINEHGILQRVSEPYYAKKPSCTGSSVKFFAITLHDVQPAFIFLGSGYALALILFMMEVAAAKYQRKRNLRKVVPVFDLRQELEYLQELEMGEIQ